MMIRAAALCTALFGCAKHEPRTYEVAIVGMQFVPAELSVSIGDTIVWTNQDVLPHTVTSGIPSPIAFDSKEIASHREWRMTASAPGEYAYTCAYHPTMRAKLVVR